MGYRFRKSINLGGGFRVNISKSGIGYSWGVKGYRATKTAKGTVRKTYSIPGTGFSYVEETKKEEKYPSFGYRQNKTPIQHGAAIMIGIISFLIILYLIPTFVNVTENGHTASFVKRTFRKDCEELGLEYCDANILPYSIPKSDDWYCYTATINCNGLSKKSTDEIMDSLEEFKHTGGRALVMDLVVNSDGDIYECVRNYDGNKVYKNGELLFCDYD